MPHDGVNEDKRLSTWENLSNRITEIPPSKNLIILGDFNTQLHTRKEGEEPYLGLHILGKGNAFLLNKENLQGEKVFNRNSFTDLLREHDLRAMNTFFHKPPREKATCKFVGVVGNIGPWTTDRYFEIDFCLVRNRWHNSILDIKTDPFTNIATDHKMLKVQFKQKLKAISTEPPAISLKGLKPKNEQQIADYQAAVRARILSDPHMDMHTL
eukprot:10861108-Heterocapsa_arctica.AAC.1